MNNANLTEYEEDKLAEEEEDETPKPPKNRLGLECQLSDWDGWDDNGIMCPQFYKVVLRVPVGDFPVGHKFPVAFFNGDDSTITFCDEKDNHYTYGMLLTLGQKVEKSNG
jgi:hypothetical protein